jgi:23S rRNA (pseudouridine1915-N3)-methyltransferase
VAGGGGDAHIGCAAARRNYFARRIERWKEEGRDVAFVIGGADGMAVELQQQAEWVFSLSPLTLPHGLCRVVLAEQIYRAVSLLAGHPYHRE